MISTRKNRKQQESLMIDEEVSTSVFIQNATNASMKKRYFWNSSMQGIFLVAAFFAGLFVLFITLFLVINSAEFFSSWEKLQGIVGGEVWEVNLGQFGSKNLIIGSLIVTLFASLIVIPLGIFIGIFLAEICPRKLKNFVKPTIELISAMPSIVLGLLAIKYLIPFTRNSLLPIYKFFFLLLNPAQANIAELSSGYLAITASMALAFMTIPFIASLTDDALVAVPQDLKKASLALGSSKWEVIKNVSIPYSTSSIISACILAFGRIIGETMVVAMVTALTWNLTSNYLDPFQGVFPVPGVIAREYGNVNPNQPEYFALSFIGLELLLIAFVVTMVGRNIAKGKIKFPSFRKIRNYHRVTMLPTKTKKTKSNIFKTKFGKTAFIFWIFTIGAGFWKLYWSINSGFIEWNKWWTYVSLILSITAFIAISAFSFTDFIKRENNKLAVTLAGLPLIISLILSIYYPLDRRYPLALLVMFICSFVFFYTYTHGIDKTIENEKLAKKRQEAQRIREGKEFSEEANQNNAGAKLRDKDFIVKMNQTFSTLASKMSAGKNIKQKIYFTLFAIFAGAILLLILAIIVALLIDGTGSHFALGDIFLVGRGEIHFGWLPSILGSISVVAFSALLGLPISTLAGIYLFFYGRPRETKSRFGRIYYTNILPYIRNSIQNIASVPSVVVGLFGWGVFVLWFGWGHSLLAGAWTLSIMMIPIATSTTIKALEQVPDHFRLNALAMGATKWQSIWTHTLKYALPSIVTGYLFSISRVIGETAPIMLTVAVANVGSVFPSRLTGQGVAMLPFTIWYLALFTPSTSLRDPLAWAMSGAMLLLFIAAIIYIIGQILRARFQVRYE